MLTRYGTELVGLAAGIAALIYIGRKIGRVAVILQLLARLPDEHAQLLQATRDNTTAIASLVEQMGQLTADIAKLTRT